METSPNTTYSIRTFCNEVLVYAGLPFHGIHCFTFLQCNVETASKFCKVDWCPFYKNINLQYITLSNLNLYIFFPPVIGDTRQFVQVRKNIWLFTSGLIVNRINQKWWGGYCLRKYKYSVIVIVVNKIQLLTKWYKINHLRFLL